MRFQGVLLVELLGARHGSTVPSAAFMPEEFAVCRESNGAKSAICRVGWGQRAPRPSGGGLE